MTLDEAERCLEALFDDNLLLCSTAERFRFHDLVRDCAYGLFEEYESEAVRRATEHRILDYYLYAARTWSSDIALGAFRFDAQVTQVPEHVKSAVPADDSIAMLAAEYRNLVVASRFAAENGWRTHSWQLPCALQPFLKLQNYGGDSLELFQGALRAARDLGDARGESAALTGMALVYRERGAKVEARNLFEQAIAISRERGDKYTLAWQLADLGVVHINDDRLEDAHASFRHARDLAEEAGDQRGYVAQINNLGVTCRDLGRLDEALEHFSYVLAQHSGDESHGMPALLAMWNIGSLYHLRGRIQDAVALFEEVLGVSRERRFSYGEALGLVGLCAANRALGKLTLALECGREALSQARRSSFLEVECDALDSLGETFFSVDELEHAESAFENARAFVVKHGFMRYGARAMEGLAHVSLARGNLADARSRWVQALRLYPAGLIDAQNPRRHLSSLDTVGTKCARCAITVADNVPG